MLFTELETNFDHIIALFNQLCVFMKYSYTDICVTFDRPPVITIMYFLTNLNISLRTNSNFNTNSKLQPLYSISHFLYKLNIKKQTFLLNAHQCISGKAVQPRESSAPLWEQP